MATDQGGASVWVRKGKVAIIADSVIEGAPDEHGVKHGLRIVDWDAYASLISVDAADEAFGAAVRSALLCSRLDYPRSLANEREAAGNFGKQLAKAFGLSSPRSLYSGMREVFVLWALGNLTLSPSRHRRGSHFEGFSLGANQGHEDIVLLFSASDAKLGAALRVCIERCL